MTALLNIRPLTAEDHTTWLPLWLGYLEFYKTNLAPEITKNTWAQILKPDVSPHALGAFNKEGTLIGFTHYHFHTSCWTTGPYCYLQDLYVDNAARGEGAGRALIEAVYENADKAGASQVYWLTAENNTGARKLYDKIGELTPFIKYQKP